MHVSILADSKSHCGDVHSLRQNEVKDTVPFSVRLME